MEAQRLRYLLEQYYKGWITDAEKAELDAWYETMQVTGESFFAAGTQPGEEVSLLLEQLHKRMPQTAVRPLQKPAVKKLPMAGWAAAASLLIAVAAAWMMNHRQPASVTTARSSSPKIAQQDTMLAVALKTNTGDADMQLVLEDGTLLVLSKQASVQYPMHFSGNKREVTIQGKVFFDVAKDKARPFTVYTAHVATTVLGTSFTVQERKDGVSVKLFSGKVQVKPTDETYAGWKQQVVLHPGEQLYYNMEKASLAVTPAPATTGSRLAVTDSNEVSNGNELVFANAALPQVFENIGKFYNISIRYEKAQVKALYFSGTMQKSDAPEVILNAIAQMNGLEVQEADHTYIIRVAE